MNDFNTHENRRLPNGNILLLGSRDVVSTVYQGGTQQDPVDILGDMTLVRDHNFNWSGLGTRLRTMTSAEWLL